MSSIFRTNRVEKTFLLKREPRFLETHKIFLLCVAQKSESLRSPEYGDTVLVFYTGSLFDGDVFNNSLEREKPVSFRIGQVIQG